jgi:hypothetical protein
MTTFPSALVALRRQVAALQAAAAAAAEPPLTPCQIATHTRWCLCWRHPCGQAGHWSGCWCTACTDPAHPACAIAEIRAAIIASADAIDPSNEDRLTPLERAELTAATRLLLSAAPVLLAPPADPTDTDVLDDPIFAARLQAAARTLGLLEA